MNAFLHDLVFFFFLLTCLEFSFIINTFYCMCVYAKTHNKVGKKKKKITKVVKFGLRKPLYVELAWNGIFYI